MYTIAFILSLKNKGVRSCFVGKETRIILSHGSGAAWLSYARHFKPQRKQERRTPKKQSSLSTLILNKPLLQNRNRQLQRKPWNAEAEAEIHHEKTRVTDRLEFAVEVVVDMLTHHKRRRREGKTDFHACKKMTKQTGHKYNPKKYCLAIHFTNREFIVQVAHTIILGDKIEIQATSTEVHRYDACTVEEPECR